MGCEGPTRVGPFVPPNGRPKRPKGSASVYPIDGVGFSANSAKRRARASTTCRSASGSDTADYVLTLTTYADYISEDDRLHRIWLGRLQPSQTTWST